MNGNSFGLLTSAYPKKGLILARLAFVLGKQVKHISFPTTACMNCGSSNADFYPVAVKPDFDTSVLPRSIRSIFYERAFGICQICGLAQDYRRLSLHQLHEYCQTLESKDQAVSEEAFHTFPVPKEYVDYFNNRYFGIRTERWRTYFDKERISINKALFLRPFFGAAPLFIHKFYGAKCYGLEISNVARNTVESLEMGFEFLQGNIHGYFEGEFLQTGPYDVIFDFHTLVHCIDIHDSLRKLKSLLKTGGAIVFTHEINVKPSNPFHLVYADEKLFLNILSKHFKRIDRIDACEENPDPHIKNFTFKSDCPDFVAWLD